MSTTSWMAFSGDATPQRSPLLSSSLRGTLKVSGSTLKLTAPDGYADVLLGEQTRRRAKALAEAMKLKLEI